MRELGRGRTLVAAAVAQLENKVNHRFQDKKPTQDNKNPSKQMPVDTKKSAEDKSADHRSKYNKDKLTGKESSSSENEEYKSSTHKAESTASDSVSMKSSERDSSDSEESSTSEGSSLARRTPQDPAGSTPHQVRPSDESQLYEGDDNNISLSDDDDLDEEHNVYEDEDESADELVLAVSGLHPAVSSYMYSSIGSDSDSPDDSSTVKCATWSDSNISVGHPNSSTSDTSSSSDKSHKQKGKPIEDTTRCDDDFQWIKTEPTASVSYDKSSNPVPDASLSADTDEEECRKIVQAKRPELPKFCSEKPPVPTNSHERSGTGSLDRRRYHPPNRVDRDQKSKSTHNLKGNHYPPSKHYNGSNNNHRSRNESPGPYVDYMGNSTQDYHSQDYGYQYHSFTPPRQMSDFHRRAISYEQFNRRHEHNDPQRYGSNSMLMDRIEGPKHVDYHGHHHPDMRGVPYHYGSRPDIHGSHGELSCCGGPVYPPCCHHSAPPWCSCTDRYRTQYSCKNSEAVEDKLRRLENDKEQLQLQVSVLSEQIAAQSEKINDLERLLNEKRNLLTNAEELLQREMLTRSSLETQKLELMSTISDARLRQAALERENIELRSGKITSMSHNVSSSIPNGGAALRRQSPSPCPSPGPITPREGSTPRTPPATYRRLVSDQSPHQYSSLPRGASLSNPVSRPSPGPQTSLQSSTPLDTAVVVRFADKDTVIGTASPVLGKVGGGANSMSGKGWGNLWRGGSGGALEDVGDGPVEPFQRGGVRATAAPRLQTIIPDRWNTVPPKEWDTEITCEWLEALGLDCYSADARKWLTNPAGNRGILASATHQQIEKELNLKNPLHKKKIVLALMDLQGGPGVDPLMKAAGRLDCAWAMRWLEDAGLPQYREAWGAAGADGRVLHLLSHEDLHALKVTSQLHALSIKRGIQVLRENNFSPDTMIRRATVVDNNESGEGGVGEEGPDCVGGHVSRWSSHRVMEWLRAVDLAEYAPNLRGAGVHGGLMYYEVRFTGELLATLLNIPPSKTLLRRHLNTRFNQLLGKEVIQEKREAEQTLGYQPLTLTSKVKIVKKGQFTLKRKKNKGEPEYGDLVCPIVDQASGEILSTMKMEVYGGEGAASRQTDELSSSTDSPHSQRSDRSHS